MADAPQDSPGERTASQPPRPKGERGVLVWDALALGLACALIGSLPAALRTSRAGGPLLGGWLGAAATVMPFVIGFIALGAAAGRGFRMLTGNRAGRSTAAGLALWMGLVAPVIAVLGSILKTGTNHRGIGGATFGVVGLAIVILGAIVAYRMMSLARAMVERGWSARMVAVVYAAITIAPPFATAFLLGRSNDDASAARALVATVVDVTIFVVAAALAASVDLKPEVRARTRLFGSIGALALFGGGLAWVATSPTLGPSIRGGGGLASTVISTLQGWTDRDGDGKSSWFGGGDCDDRDAANACAGAAKPALTSSPADAPTDEAAATAAEPGRRGRSVFVVTVENLRADHTNPYGYEPKTTPTLASLAKQGLVFDHAYAAGADTQHAIVPVVSGKSFGATPHDRREWPTIDASAETVAERMRAAGYATLGVTSFTWLTDARGFDQGFDAFQSVYKEDHPERGITGPHAVRAFRALLKDADAGDKPIFGWVHLFDTHKKFLPHTGLSFGKSDEGLYDGEVAYVDQRIGEIVASIRESAHGKDAVIVIHGASGQSFSEHKKAGLYDESARVPMIVLGGATGTFDASAVSTFDVVPTVLDVGGVTLEPGALPGRSLLQVASNKVTAAPIVIDAGKERAVLDWPLKLLAGGGGTRLFDLSKDPGEKHDLAPSKDADRLKSVLDAASDAPRKTSAQKVR